MVSRGSRSRRPPCGGSGDEVTMAAMEAEAQVVVVV
uniref:Uncharacterized protein n=1 Tax=Arundo donax TaxID=35708 RepID=A0A0A9EB88_ARUDO